MFCIERKEIDRLDSDMEQQSYKIKNRRKTEVTEYNNQTMKQQIQTSI